MSANPERYDVSIDKLHFDSQNPRLPETMERGNQDEVIAWMLRKGDIIELMASIAATGFSSAEAVLAIPHPSHNGEYEVVEGNRRLAAVKLLKNPALAGRIRPKAVLNTSENAKYRPDEIPVLVYRERAEILAYLGYRHITGIKAWGAEEKAKYLRQLFEHLVKGGKEEQEAFATITEIVATKPYYAKKMLVTLALTEKAQECGFWELDRLTPEDVKFSVLGTALSYSSISDYIGLSDATDRTLEGLDEDKLRDLYSWLFQRDPDGNRRISESRELKRLAKVLEHEPAKAAFMRGASLDHAEELTDAADELFKKFIEKAVDDLETAQKQLKRLSAPNEADLDTLRMVWKLARDMGFTLKARIEDNGDEGF